MRWAGRAGVCYQTLLLTVPCHYCPDITRMKQLVNQGKRHKKSRFLQYSHINYSHSERNNKLKNVKIKMNQTSKSSGHGAAPCTLALCPMWGSRHKQHLQGDVTHLEVSPKFRREMKPRSFPPRSGKNLLVLSVGKVLPALTASHLLQCW